MPTYTVHIYREMKLTFRDIEAASPQAAAAIARDGLTSDADDIDDCEGENLAALVDQVGDEEYAHSMMIDFDGVRMRKLAPRLLEALTTVVSMEYDRDPDSRNFDDERLEAFSALIAEAEAS